MKELLMVCANVMISLYIPYEIGRMLVEGVSRKEMAARVGLSDADSIARLGSRSWIIRGGVFLSLMRKELTGLAAVLFVMGLLTGSVAGYGWMALLWFIELLVLAAWIDWNRNVVALSREENSLTMNNRRERRRLHEAIHQGARSKRHDRDNRMTAH